MILAKIAAYIIAIVAILGLSVKFLWLFFILFTYRTYSSLISFEWMQQIGIESHIVYFIIILTLSFATYGLLMRYTLDLTWIRFVVLGILILWVFKNYSFQDIFLFKDYLESKGMWDFNWYINQIKELFSSDPGEYSNLFSGVFDEVFGIFEKIFNGISSKANS